MGLEVVIIADMHHHGRVPTPRVVVGDHRRGIPSLPRLSGPVYGGGLVVHGAGGVVSTSPPIFSTADLRVAVAACLFDAERHRDVGVGVWDRQECTTFAF